MQIFDGRAEAKKLDEKILDFIKKSSLSSDKLSQKTLAIIQVGDNLSSEKYIKVKKTLGEKLGIRVVLHKLDTKIGTLELEDYMRGLVGDSEVGGIIVQLPLPRSELNSVLDLIPPEKDIDLLSGARRPLEAMGSLDRLSPTVRAAEHFIYSIKDLPTSKKAIIVGGGKLVGIPLASYLKTVGWEVEIDENYSRGKRLDSNLIVSSTGIPNLVAGEDISAGANVIDFGSSVVDGKVVGDLDMNTKLDHLNLISPSPGGMGPLTVRYLFMNFLRI